MERFPEAVRNAMTAGGAEATCLPVRIVDGEERLDGAEHDAAGNIDFADMHAQGWETAIFFRVAGPEAKDDRRVLRNTTGALSVGGEADLIEHSNAGVVVIRFEIFPQPDNPLVGEVLLTPGAGGGHFQACNLLTLQSRLRWYIADESYHVLRPQEIPWSTEHRGVFAEILNDATSHDAVVRMTSSYNAQAATSEIASHYELRETAERTGGGQSPSGSSQAQ